MSVLTFISLHFEALKGISRIRFSVCLCVWMIPFALNIQAQIPSFPLSTASELGCVTCYDTVRVLMFKKIYDLSLLFPEWNPVVDWGHVEAAEGIVVPSSGDYIGTHVSQEDFSAYHYTHDFGFNIHLDSAYRRLLARRVYTGHEIDHPDKADTIIQSNLHVEWESGLVAGNEGNPCSDANRRGESCGFASAGHKRGETIWNWPTIGDWVHCEGVWVWDRGHPPAYTELHPLRLMATRRAMGAYIPAYGGAPDSIFATRIDIFASGDGGALYNNRSDRAAFAHSSPMDEKDYAFVVRPNVPRPSKDAVLRWRIENRRGDNLKDAFFVRVQDSVLRFTIGWVGHPADAVLAKTVYCWWEDQKGAVDKPDFQVYDVQFESLHFYQRKDFGSRPERIIWLEAGGQYICLNEFEEGDNILEAGAAKSYRREWDIGKTFRIYGRAGQTFRVHVGGWESDGYSQAFGHLLDPNLPCNDATKKAIHKHLWPATPFGLKGCLDDLIGEVHAIHEIGKVGAYEEYEAMSQGSDDGYEQCPGANTEQKDVFKVSYSIRRVR